MKSMTPVVSVILLILITIVASVSAFFFINSSVSDLQAQGNLDSFPGNDKSDPHYLTIMALYGIHGTEQWSQQYLCDADLYVYPGDSLTLADIDGDGVIEIIYAADDTEELPY